MKTRILTLAILLALGLSTALAQTNSGSNAEEGENSDGQQNEQDEANQVIIEEQTDEFAQGKYLTSMSKQIGATGCNM